MQLLRVAKPYAEHVLSAILPNSIQVKMAQRELVWYVTAAVDMVAQSGFVFSRAGRGMCPSLLYYALCPPAAKRRTERFLCPSMCLHALSRYIALVLNSPMVPLLLKWDILSGTASSPSLLWSYGQLAGSYNKVRQFPVPSAGLPLLFLRLPLRHYRTT